MRAPEPVLFGDPAARYMLLQPVDEHDLAVMEGEAAVLEALRGGRDWCVAALPVADWFRDLAPWPAPPVFGGQSFGDGAGETLRILLDEVIPALEQAHPGSERTWLLGGYSLAGLFALWAAFQTDRFAGIAAVSPSVWYPGWLGYARAHPVKAGHVYLSLGDREEKTRNPVMAAVGDAIRAQHGLLTEAGVPCRLDWNPGNHFADSDRRTAKGFAWLLEALSPMKED